MKLIKFAQSTFLFQNNEGRRLLVDPGEYNFGDGFTPESFGHVDVLIITHKHGDHFQLDAVKRLFSLSHCEIITNSEIAVILQKNTVRSRIVNLGENIELHGFILSFIKTDHVVRDESIVNFGMVIRCDGITVYHTSDTRLMEIQTLPAVVVKPDILCVPIGNRGVVMGIDDALYFTSEIKPNIVIPMHYDSPKDKGRVKPEHFLERLNVLKSSLESLRDVRCNILKFGEEFTAIS
jgi:L-ascorbate metabolism protein UlaG (beta-lactamase superfamily)